MPGLRAEEQAQELAAKALGILCEESAKWYSDCTIVVRGSGAPVKVPCHRAVLAVRNPFFSRLFRSSPDDTCFDLSSDVAEEVLRPVLRWVYTGRVAVDVRLVLPLASAAEYFEDPLLRDAVMEWVRCGLPDEGVAELARDAIELCEDSIVDVCVRRLLERADSLLAADAAETLPESVAVRLLSDHRLAVHDEAALFDFCRRWALRSAGPGQARAAARPLVRHLRLTLIGAQRLRSLVEPSGLVDEETIAVAYRRIALGDLEDPRG
eukprot:TRINITY_DN10516_c0_g1_i2.p2 TRINITY_DN10516_c0_g1~~TRINITY_DN10516_c0_g1_i2.p2  ORF type:complete len:281 (+),score=109.75 TRINITY_DN10516_c0_g1_i2:48-845(+)